MGTALLYGSLLTHFVLALVSLYRRSTLRMPVWEAAQMLLGLAIPPLLIGHIVGTRFTWTLLGHNIDYERVVGLLWSSEWGITRQSLLLLIVWAHVCAGLHYWLRVRQWYRAEPLAFALALLLPAIALAGFASAGFYLWPSVESVGGMQKYNVDLAGMSDAERMRMAAWRSGLEYGFWLLLAATLLARWLRTRIGATYQVRHASGPRDRRAGRPQPAGSDPRRGHPARLGVRRPRALHHLPRAGERRARAPAAAGAHGGAGARPHPGAAQRAPRLPVPPDARRHGDAAAAAERRPAHARASRRAARRGASGRSWRCSSTCATRRASPRAACPTTWCSS